MREINEKELRNVDGGFGIITGLAIAGAISAGIEVAKGAYREYLENKHNIDLDGDGDK